MKAWQAQNPGGPLEPGFGRFTPNKLQGSINSIDDPNEERVKWLKIKPKIEQMATSAIESKLKTMSDKNHPLHLNYYYWARTQT